MSGIAKYRWADWLSNPRTVLVRGKDYHTSQSTMTAMIRNAASHRRVRVRLKDCGDSIVIEVVGEIYDTDKTRIPR